jgi:secretion/DNA translocation related TadE-like protein
MRRREQPDRGSATLFAVACLGLLLTLGAALGVVAAIVADHRTAQAAADLAALAGASSLQTGADPCASADGIAIRNGAAMIACDVSGESVRVRVRVDGPRWLGQHGDLVAEARAGPDAGP